MHSLNEGILGNRKWS